MAWPGVGAEGSVDSNRSYDIKNGADVLPGGKQRGPPKIKQHKKGQTNSGNDLHLKVFPKEVPSTSCWDSLKWKQGNYTRAHHFETNMCRKCQVFFQYGIWPGNMCGARCTGLLFGLKSQEELKITLPLFTWNLALTFGTRSLQKGTWSKPPPEMSGTRLSGGRAKLDFCCYLHTWNNKNTQTPFWDRLPPTCCTFG